MENKQEFVENFANVLESMNMKATAEAFKKEFSQFSNSNNPSHNNTTDKEAHNYNALKQIYNKLNTKNKFASPTNNLNKLQPQEANRIMDNLIEKITKKYSFDNTNDIQMFASVNNINSNSNQTTNTNSLLKTKVFTHLMNKFENTNTNTHINVNINNPQYSNQNIQYNNQNFVDKYTDEDDLPHFGGSSKKGSVDQNEFTIAHNLHQSHGNNSHLHTHNVKASSEVKIIENHQIHDSNLNTLNQKTLPNPNNTLKNDSGIEEDSIFIEGEGASNINNMNIQDKNKLNLNLKFEADPQLDNMIKSNLNSNIFAMINTNQENNPDSSSFFQNSQSMIIQNDDSNLQNQSIIDEYVDDDDPGFDLYECEMEYFKETCKKLSEQYDFPKRAVVKSKFKNNENLAKEGERLNTNPENEGLVKSIKVKEGEKKNQKGELLYEIDNNPQNNQNNQMLNNSNNNSNNNLKKTLLPSSVKFMDSGNSYYPVQYNNVIYDSFNLKVIVDRERTGFEESKEFKIVVNSLIAGRYQVVEYLGSAAFSKAIKCLDIVENRLVCLKIIENNKDYVDQSIDEIKLLRYINANGNSEDKCFLKIHDYFYHKEHLFIVTELLKDNLYDFYKYLNENNVENYFTLGRLQKISIQILTCLEYLHSLKLIHCDLKPENVLIKSITDVTVKVIDFGSSCFIHDHLSSYVQSRSYRAPEVIIGCKYDYKIDLWSLGCILAELYTGNVLFQNDSIQSLLARIMGIIGPFPDWMLEKGKLVNDYFTKEKLLFMEVNESANNTGDNVFNNLSRSHHSHKSKKKMHILIPKRTQLKKRLKTNDERFFDFMKSLLEVDPNLRLSASEALNHPWITHSKY